MLARWDEGCWDVVYGTRIDREGESLWKLGTAKLFYRLINSLSDVAIPLDTGDFRLMDRKIVDALLSMPERDRFLRGMVSWLGFRQLALPYRRAARFAGTTKYPMRRMLRFAMDGILSFSVVPLRIATMVGLTASVMALIGCCWALGVRLLGHHWVAGWTSLLLTVLFMGGAGGSLRAGVTDNPVRLTRSVKEALTRVTSGGAPVYVWPGGGITFMVDVTRLPAGAFGYVPTPALVAPIEFTLRVSDYAALGGHMDHVRPLVSLKDNTEIRQMSPQPPKPGPRE